MIVKPVLIGQFIWNFTRVNYARRQNTWLLGKEKKSQDTNTELAYINFICLGGVLPGIGKYDIEIQTGIGKAKDGLPK